MRTKNLKAKQAKDTATKTNDARGDRPRYMKLSTASEEFSISVDSIRDKIYQGKLEAKQFGDKPRGRDTRPFLVRPEDIEALMVSVQF